MDSEAKANIQTGATPTSASYGKIAGGAYAVTKKSIERIEEYLCQPFFTERGRMDPANAKMIQRLRLILARGEKAQGADAVFYLHELHEMQQVERLLRAGKNMEEAYATAHKSVLKAHGESAFSVYHPEVIRSLPEYFGDAWFEFWGIKR